MSIFHVVLDKNYATFEKHFMDFTFFPASTKPLLVENVICRTTKNGVEKVWTMNIIKIFFWFSPNDLLFKNLFRFWIGSSAGPHITGSDAIYMEYPLLPSNIQDESGGVLDTEPKAEGEEGKENESNESSAALATGEVFKAMKGEKVIIRFIAKNKKGKKLQFTNQVFNDGQLGGNLQIVPKIVPHEVKNGKKVYGKHRNPQGCCIVGIVDTEKSLGVDETAKGYNGDAMADAAYGGSY